MIPRECFRISCLEALINKKKFFENVALHSYEGLLSENAAIHSSPIYAEASAMWVVGVGIQGLRLRLGAMARGLGCTVRICVI